MTVPERYSLLVPFFNEAERLPATLASIAAQTLDPARLFVVGVDDGSTDAGPEVFRAWLAETGRAGILVRGGARSIPAALNRGLREADARDGIVRLDAHTRYAPDYLARIDAAFARLGEDVRCVGNAQVPGPQRDFARRVHAALYTNPLGLGPTPYRTARDERDVPDVYLGAWRPGVLQALGGWDERWRANEDSELSARLRTAGGRIRRIDLRADYVLTCGPLGAIRKWGRYGFWRAQTLKAHPETLRPRHLAPSLAVLGAGALAASPARAALAPLVAAYALAVVARRPATEPVAVTLAAIPFFATLQCAFGLGILRGFLRPLPPPATGGADPYRTST